MVHIYVVLGDCTIEYCFSLFLGHGSVEVILDLCLTKKRKRKCIFEMMCCLHFSCPVVGDHAKKVYNSHKKKNKKGIKFKGKKFDGDCIVSYDSCHYFERMQKVILILATTSSILFC